MATPGDALAAVVALLVGYLIGSVPVSALVGRAAGISPGRGAATGTGAADVWRLAGAGPGLLALTGEVARGVIPVALGIVTWSWAIGWVAGIGALLGACWPLLGRLRSGHGVATLAGVGIALAPAAGALAVLPAILALVIARLLGRNGQEAATVAGLGSFAVLVVAGQADLARLAALGGLSLVAALCHLAARR